MPSTIADAPLFGSLPHPPLRYPLTSASTDLISNNVTAFRFSFICILYRETYFTDVSCPKVERQIVKVWVISKILYTNPDTCTSPAVILVCYVLEFTVGSSECSVNDKISNELERIRKVSFVT